MKSNVNAKCQSWVCLLCCSLGEWMAIYFHMQPSSIISIALSVHIFKMWIKKRPHYSESCTVLLGHIIFGVWWWKFQTAKWKMRLEPGPGEGAVLLHIGCLCISEFYSLGVYIIFYILTHFLQHWYKNCFVDECKYFSRYLLICHMSVSKLVLFTHCPVFLLAWAPGIVDIELLSSIVLKCLRLCLLNFSIEMQSSLSYLYIYLFTP